MQASVSRSGGIPEMIGKSVGKSILNSVGMGDSVAESEEDDDEDEESCGMDDGSYPAGPRNDANKSRYHVQPSHGQGTVDLLRFTANLNSLIDRIETVANG